MQKNKALILGGCGAGAIVAIAAAAFALAPDHPRGLAALDFNHDGQVTNPRSSKGPASALPSSTATMTGS